MTAKAIFFDFDGTLADTAPDMADALNAWLQKRGRDPIPLSAVRAKVSGGALGLLKMAGLQGECETTARDDYLNLYEQGGYSQTKLFAGVADMIESLTAKKIRWGVVTNKPRRYFAPLAKKLRLQKMAATVLLAGDDCARSKPHPDLLLAAAGMCGLPPARCVYAGDDLRDGQAAGAAGMDFYIAAWGYWQWPEWKESPPPAAAAVSHPGALPKLLI